MEINIREDRKLVEIWLTGAEGDRRLDGLCGRYSAMGYLVAVFRSGTEDLTELTAGLLGHNQRTLAGEGRP